MEVSPPASFLDALQMAPDLMCYCKAAAVLKALRGVCRTTRRLATSSVRVLTIEAGNTAQQAFLKNCSLTKLLVRGGDAVVRNGQLQLTGALNAAVREGYKSLCRLSFACIVQTSGDAGRHAKVQEGTLLFYDHDEGRHHILMYSSNDPGVRALTFAQHPQTHVRIHTHSCRQTSHLVAIFTPIFVLCT